MERWEEAVETSKDCAELAREKVPEGGKKRFKKYIKCRMAPSEHGIE